MGIVPTMTHTKSRASGYVPLFLATLIALSRLFAAEPARGANLEAQKREIFVTSNGWHSEIFVARAAIPRDAIPVTSEFPNAVFLGFGWGDAEFFPARDPGILTWLSAAFQPTPAVLHVTGLSSHPRDAFPKGDVIGLTVSVEGFRNLLGFFNATFSRDAAGRVTDHAPGLHAFSRFYPATGKFHMFNNCNSWTARGLAAAGLPIESGGIVLADDLMTAVREIAQSKSAAPPAE